MAEGRWFILMTARLGMPTEGDRQPGANAEQVERYRFEATFPGTEFPGITVDEPPPVGTGLGPSPVRMLAAAVAHCMSSTLYNALERARVSSTPIRTRVDTEVGRNSAGRLRVRRLEVTIEASPLRIDDRGRFDRCVAIFEDYCTVSGAVREGIEIRTAVGPSEGPHT